VLRVVTVGGHACSSPCYYVMRDDGDIMASQDRENGLVTACSVWK